MIIIYRSSYKGATLFKDICNRVTALVVKDEVVHLSFQNVVSSYALKVNMPDSKITRNRLLCVDNDLERTWTVSYMTKYAKVNIYTNL